MNMLSDPLRIYYVLVMRDEGVADKTPFQGFSSGWRNLHWAMGVLGTLPADVGERAYPAAQVAVHRIAGLKPVAWFPLMISALEALPVAELPPCLVLFSGEPEVAERVETWSSDVGALHISTVEGFGTSISDFDINFLRSYCRDRLLTYSDILSEEQKEFSLKFTEKWDFESVVLENYEIKNHNITLPNHMSLERVGFNLRGGESFVSTDEGDYIDAILDSANAVAVLRYEFGWHEIYRLGPRPTAVILFEPALFRFGYKRISGKSAEMVQFRNALRYFQQQKLLKATLDSTGMERLTGSKEGKFIVEMRASELVTQSLGVGLFADQAMTPVVRLSPGVNHVFPDLSAYARNLRADRFEARRKAAGLFAKIQDKLKTAVGEARLAFIDRTDGPIKIISDAPIEWLPIGQLPLAFARDCSRIPVTPGDVMMSNLLPLPLISIPPEAFRKVLVVSSFRDDDPLRDLLKISLEATRPGWESVIDFNYIRVSSVEEFISALNEFDGDILIFDGHGASNDSTPIGTIVIGDSYLDVWSLREAVRCPAVVILSACDTHGIDASSHATVGNGFLMLGARTVLGTLLPVDGRRSAMFIARLMLRIAQFIPASLTVYKRSLTWVEVISGMLRMCLATEIITALAGRPGSDIFNKLQGQANHDINGHNPDWFDHLVTGLAEFLSLEVDVVYKRVQRVIAQSDAIRYVQLGNPETIVIMDETLIESVIRKREAS